MGAEALALHGIHDSVLISGRKSVIICVMLGASPTALPTVRPTRLFFILLGRGDHNAPIKI